ncbi:GGDEF domain-containing protein [Nitrincola tibetensis]|uniref:diguanylate cyclase n=1 Tax=Nitrincola tibetensis TaxID=2219697 RepID=A0A364NI05_9GAMM|nr:GGDEF domain-containing protein [Nitrincola tibetensis]RAU16758.1 GGDEF domain-containing protein [Nitrincola tibetensis]
MYPLQELFSAGSHTHYFQHTRSYYIFRRVRIIALLLAILQSAWILVDQWLLPANVQWPIAIARVISSLFFLGLFFWQTRPYSSRLALLRLLLLFTGLTAFHAFSSALLLIHGYEQSVAGYQFFPFMIISMMAIFPLVIIEVLGLTLLLTSAELVTQLTRGILGNINSINNVWLLLVLAIVAAWATVNQLNMLLVLHRQATRDALTGLANRRLILEQLDSDMESCRENTLPLAVLLFDLDKFKGFNDTYGHAAGDIVLKQFANILRKHTRKKLDLAGRFGGEEFLMILPGVDEEAAIEVAKAIGLTCRQTSVAVPSGEKVGFTTSIGIAVLKPGESQSDLIRRADEALYSAKDAGRDRYEIA